MHPVIPYLLVLSTVAHALDNARSYNRVKQVQLVKHLCLLALALGHSTVLCDLKDLSCEVVWSNGYPSTFTATEA